MITDAIKKVVDGHNLKEEEAVAVMEEIMAGEATDAQIAAFITAMRMKGETVDEIAGFARVMRAKATPIKHNAKVLVDTCGTGGDLSSTFNISTTTAFVVAGAGVAVAKHGNRSVSSACGSADLLEALGVKIDVSPEVVGQAIDEVGIGFMFAPLLHQAMKYAIGPRKEIAIRTVFNILGPLTNPARANYQLLGVYDPNLTETIANVLGNLGVEHGLVVHGNGLDELTVTGDSKVSEVKNGKVSTYVVEPACLDLELALPETLLGGAVEKNTAITKGILSGKKGPARDIVLLNSAAALMAAEVVGSLKEGITRAGESIDSGAAQDKLEQLIAFTRRH